MRSFCDKMCGRKAVDQVGNEMCKNSYQCFKRLVILHENWVISLCSQSLIENLKPGDATA